jgi:hypothetical protein
VSGAGLINPSDLQNDLDRLEEIEKTSLRLVVQSIYDYRTLAHDIFVQESDAVADIGEDITREALDRIGMSRIDQRLFGKVDYKRARYLFHPQYAVKQALFVDSKAEKAGVNTMRLQVSQTSMRIRQVRATESLDIPGRIPVILEIREDRYITTTIFVKYNYLEIAEVKNLDSITVVALPSGFLQERYNPNAADGIWSVGPDSPLRGEEFRTRLNIPRLAEKAAWRVQTVPMGQEVFSWQD